MSLLGIDYGLKKIGLAIADGPLAEPFRVIRFESEVEAIKKICRVVEEEKIEKIVVGVSEGKSEALARSFGDRLAKDAKIPVVYSDETLSTRSAQELSIEAGMGRKKRKNLEDAFAAAVMLQLFVDENV